MVSVTKSQVFIPVMFTLSGAQPTMVQYCRLVLPDTGPHQLEINTFSGSHGNMVQDIDPALTTYFPNDHSLTSLQQIMCGFEAEEG